MGDVSYTYVMVRQDLPFPVQLVQASHAAFEMGRDLERPAVPLVDNLIVLGVRDTRALLEAREYLERHGVRHYLFHEPDYNTGYTALCTEPVCPTRKRLFKRWQLVA